jgi:hypothetical protein
MKMRMKDKRIRMFLKETRGRERENRREDNEGQKEEQGWKSETIMFDLRNYCTDFGNYYIILKVVVGRCCQ